MRSAVENPWLVTILLLAAGTGFLGGGCAPAVSKGDFDAPDPASRAYAIERAARSGDRSRIPQLVEQLRSDDPLVRMMAIETLERLTGETMGYRHFDSVAARSAAVDRWSQAVAAGAFTDRAGIADRPVEEGVVDAR